MSIGNLPQKADVDAMSTALTKQLNITFGQIQEFQAWLQTVPALTTMGYTTDEIATLNAAFADLDQLRTIYQGGVTLTQVKDFREFAKTLYGFGF